MNVVKLSSIKFPQDICSFVVMVTDWPVMLPIRRFVVGIDGLKTPSKQTLVLTQALDPGCRHSGRALLYSWESSRVGALPTNWAFVRPLIDRRDSTTATQSLPVGPPVVLKESPVSVIWTLRHQRLEH